MSLTTCVSSYNYPALQRISDAVRRDFASAAGLGRYERGMWDGADEPLAAIIGTDYILKADVERWWMEAFGDEVPREEWFDERYSLPIDYEQRSDLWPELGSLRSLSIAARKVFVRVVQCVELRTSLIEYCANRFLTDHLGITTDFDEALGKLVEAGLIDPEPGVIDLLNNLTVKDLKQYAFELGIKSSGPKYSLVRRLLAEVGPEYIDRLLAEKLGDGKYVKLLVDELPLLKKYVWAEKHRIDLYVDWVQRTVCSKSTHPGPVDPPEPVNRDMEPRSRWDDDPRRGLTGTEERLAREVWDSRCDEIVIELADKYAWDAPMYMSEAIQEHLGPQKLDRFRVACDRNETHIWYNLLMYYGRARLADMGIKFREPRKLKCADCDTELIESSVGGGTASRVGHKIHFCQDCYNRVLYGWQGQRACDMSQEEMINRVAALAAALECVPTATFFRDLPFSTFSDEKQIAVIRILLDMPPYKAYTSTFGSWFRVLVLAGVLEDGAQPTSRGTRCLASDGHECLSLAEKTIDDWLSAHQIPHEKEPTYPYDAHLNPMGMRADWKTGQFLIEYAGLMDEPEYAAKMEVKQALCDKFRIPLIVIEPEDILNLDQKLGQLIKP